MADYTVPEGATEEQKAELRKQIDKRIKTYAELPEGLSLEQLKKLKEELEKKQKPAGGEGNLAAIGRDVKEILDILREAKGRGKV
jgi:hypothetical protein